MDNAGTSGAKKVRLAEDDEPETLNEDELDGEDYEEDEEEEDSDMDDAEYNAFDDTTDYGEVTEHDYLKADVREAAKTWRKLEDELGIPSVQIEPSIAGRSTDCAVVLNINVSDLPDMIRHVWELGTSMIVSIIIDQINKQQFRAYETRPIVSARIDNNKPSKFPVGECLLNVIKPLISETYTLPANAPPSETGSFFSMLYEQLMERLRTLTEYCMVCGTKMYAGGLLPSICGGELCQYQYQELGLMDGLTTPRISAPVLSLLLTVFNAAVASDRRAIILNPSPATHNVDKLAEDVITLYKKHDKKYGLLNQKNIDAFSVLKMLACVMPCARDILQTPSNYRDFKKETPRIAQFVEWLAISNQSYLELVPTNHRVPFLETNAQFLFVSDTPDKQREFDALKKANGGKTRFLFHGSRKDNWHAIIRGGLKVMSGTQWMLDGETYGKGIYMSNLLQTSIMYCTMLFDQSNISETCMDNGCCFSINNNRRGGMALLAVVEVVDTPDAYTYNQQQIPNPPDGEWASTIVVKAEKWASIRMLVAYSHDHYGTSRGATARVDLDQLTPDNKADIQNVVQYFKNASITERAKIAADSSEKKNFFQ